MAQDYYFNSHNPNNNNGDKKDGGSKLDRPAPPMSAGKKSDAKKAASAKRPAKKTAGGAPRPTGPASNEKTSIRMNIVKIVLALLVICGTTGLVVSMTVLVSSISFVNGDVALDLNTEKYAQAQTTFIYGKDEKGNDTELARLYGSENRVWVDLEDMSPYLSKAFQAIEDKRFQQHHGVDWTRTIAAVVKYSGDQGGSTITQQVVKNLTDQKDVTFVRKYNEILTALNLEKHFSKDDIIETYMNTIYLSHGCYGVKTAAEKYFGKDVKDLNIAESAAIAAITQWPNKYDPINKPEKNKARQEKCLEYMKEQELITQAEYDEAMAYKLVLRGQEGFVDYVEQASSQQQQEETGEYQSYYVDYVITDVINKLVATGNYNEHQAKNAIYGGGLKIYCSVDKTVQDILEDVYVNRTNMGKDDIQSAMVVMEYDGRIAGIVGGAGEKQGNRVLNRALSKRQPGSTFKPLGVYGPAIEQNAINWSTFVKDSPSRKSGTEPWLEGNGWPTNQGETYSGSNVTVQYALSKSLNTVPVRILTDITLEASYEFLTEKAHITTLDKEKDIDYSPLALGGMTYGATVLEMTAAYQMFGNGGYYCEPYSFYKVLSSTGEVLLESNPEKDKSQAISPATSTIMNKLLQTVMNSGGTGSSYRIDSKYEMFGKTGTTTGSNDRYFIGATPYYVSAVWYGYDIPDEIRYNISSNPCGTIWKTVYSRIHSAKNLEGKKFDVSPDAVQRSYCTITGKLASKGCPTASGWYNADNLPAYCKGGHSNASSGHSSSSDGDSQERGGADGGEETGD